MAALENERERKGRLGSLMTRAQASVLSRAGGGMGTPPTSAYPGFYGDYVAGNSHSLAGVQRAIDRAIATDQTDQLDP